MSSDPADPGPPDDHAGAPPASGPAPPPGRLRVLMLAAVLGGGFVLLTLALPTWLVAGGAVWRYADRHELLRYKPYDKGLFDNEPAVRNFAVFHEPPDPARPAVYFIGNSSTAFGIDEHAMEAAWAERGAAGRARVVWSPGVDTIGAYALTQRLPDRAVAAVVLGLTPHMTLFNPDEPLDQTHALDLYVDRRHPLPFLDVAIPALSVEAWPVYHLRGPLRIVVRARAAKLLWPNRVYRASNTDLDGWLQFNDRAAFDAARARFATTRDPADYVASYAGFIHGAEITGGRYDYHTTRVWEPTSLLWPYLGEWVHLVRTLGATPVVAMMPMNPIFRDASASGVVARADQAKPLLDPERLAAWRADVARELVDRQGLVIWEYLDYLEPDGFYDLEHLLPDGRRQYSRELARRFVAEGILAPGPAPE